MMKINHLKVEGPKLSLFMKGTLNNLDSQGEIQIVGRLSQDMVQALGPLGQATLDRVVSAISPLTDIIRLTSSLYQTTVSATDKRQVPQLSQDNEGSKLFVVRINGNIYKPSSVRTFKWVQEHSVQQPQRSQQQSNPTSQEPQASDDNPQRQIDVEKLQQLIKDPKQILLRF
jgi:hypothetical protein